ncbi:MAG: hypothetical protein ACR2KB_02695 [Chitinophagaceae bacterium]
MKVDALSNEQRVIAVQRLTALWAFAESGLGGLLHALKLPFTGLMVGGMAVILITFIAFFSKGNYKTILQSLLIVLIIKAAVSPHTPFPAYIAVSFQAVAGFILFSLLSVNFVSILFFGIIAMVQSAVQKLLILTFFFGTSFWKAANELGNYIAKQFSLSSLEGSYWLVGIYFFIYLSGGVVISFTAFNMIKKFSFDSGASVYSDQQPIQQESLPIRKKGTNKRLYFIFSFFVLLSIVLYIFTPKEEASLQVLKTLIWTFTAIIVWYIILNPLLAKLIRNVLRQKRNVYTKQVDETLSFLPVIKHISATAWMRSKNSSGNRIKNFIFLLINDTLMYNDSVPSLKKK